jgi:hypothetical protein
LLYLISELLKNFRVAVDVINYHESAVRSGIGSRDIQSSKVIDQRLNEFRGDWLVFLEDFFNIEGFDKICISIRKLSLVFEFYFRLLNSFHDERIREGVKRLQQSIDIFV